MKEQQPFHLENIVRIYRGEPALIEDRLPQEVLTEEQYEAVNLIADGHSQIETAEEMGTELTTLKNWIRKAYARFGATTKDKLAGFFPLSPDDSLLEEKRLADLSPTQLTILEGLSTGYDRNQLAVQLGTAKNTIYNRIHRAYDEKWTDCGGSVNVVRVANGLRAAYIREYENAGKSIENHLGGFALDSLVSYEPKIRKIFSL